MQCIFCRGKIESRYVTFVYDHENEYFFVENVPAEVCTQCGERTYSPEVAEQLIRFARKKLSPAKTIQAPVFEYEDPVLV